MAGIELRLPNPLDCSDLVKGWPKWKQSFYIYLKANNKLKEQEEEKIATFLWLVGERGVEIFNSLYPENKFNGDFGNTEEKETEDANDDNADDDGKSTGEADDQTLEDVIKKFDDYCVPKRNIALEAFKFNMITQKERQPFVDFETALRTQMQFCEFKCSSCNASFGERMLRDRIVIGVHDKKLQLKLLESKDHPVSTIISTCKVYEAATLNKEFLERKDGPLEVKAIAVKNRLCYNCGQPYNEQHRSICPAVNVKCSLCGKMGHFRQWCRSMGNGTQFKTGDRIVRAINWDNYWGDSGNSGMFDLDQA